MASKTRKTILLHFAHDSEIKPRTFNVVYESEAGITVQERRTAKQIARYGHANEMSLEKRDGKLLDHSHSVSYVEVKQDRRPKPFVIEGREEGRGPKFVSKFATIEELRAYVSARWQGWEYADGNEAFHTDYVAYVVKGATLADLMPRVTECLDSFDTRNVDARDLEARWTNDSDHTEEHLATESEADHEQAENVGRDNPTREWICTDRDVWHRNPFFTGTRTPGHPEDEPEDEHFTGGWQVVGVEAKHTGGPTAIGWSNDVLWTAQHAEMYADTLLEVEGPEAYDLAQDKMERAKEDN